LDRLSGDPELAADLAQEAFVRLYRRGRLPDAPEAWLVTVGLNLFRSDRSTRSRRRRLMSAVRSEAAHSDPTPAADRDALADESRRRVRSALEQLTARDRELLLLRAEGYSYRELARALDLHEASIGTLLVRAREAFRQAYGSPPDAS
jgi:RNA polymerase sigma factor (sigma-70 family)